MLSILVAVDPAATPPPSAAATPARAGRSVVVVVPHGAWSEVALPALADAGLQPRLADGDTPASATERHADAEALVRDHGGLGVLWIEEGTEALYLYWVDPFDPRVHRWSVPLRGDVGDVSAALQSALRRAGGALARGADPPWHAQLAIDPAPTTPPAPVVLAPLVLPSAEPEPLDPPRSGQLRLAASYVGTTYAPEVVWRSGLGLAAGWITDSGLHVQLGYAAFVGATVLRRGGIMQTRRHPWHLGVGYEASRSRLRLGIDGVLVVDPTVRRDYYKRHGELSVERSVSVGIALAPRVRLGVVVARRVELFGSLAAELWLKQTQYRAEVSPDVSAVVLSPARVRATPALGLALRL